MSFDMLLCLCLCLCAGFWANDFRQIVCGLRINWNQLVFLGFSANILRSFPLLIDFLCCGCAWRSHFRMIGQPLCFLPRPLCFHRPLEASMFSHVFAALKRKHEMRAGQFPSALHNSLGAKGNRRKMNNSIH